jgi:Fe-S-cluster containining protein
MKCLFLDDRTNLCLIYETRPEVCRFGAKKPPNQSMTEYAEDAAAGCNLLQIMQGVDESYRVILRQ